MIQIILVTLIPFWYLYWHITLVTLVVHIILVILTPYWYLYEHVTLVILVIHVILFILIPFWYLHEQITLVILVHHSSGLTHSSVRQFWIITVTNVNDMKSSFCQMYPKEISNFQLVHWKGYFTSNSYHFCTSHDLSYDISWISLPCSSWNNNIISRANSKNFVTSRGEAKFGQTVTRKWLWLWWSFITW